MPRQSLRKSMHSAINTRIGHVQIDGYRAVQKLIQPNIEGLADIATLQYWIESYLKQMRTAKLPIPAILKVTIHQAGIEYICEDGGENLVDVIKGRGRLLDREDLFDPILNVLKLAQSFGVYLDPHLKNFVWDGKSVRYVDFSPPYGISEYRQARLKIATVDHANIVEKNLAVFAPDALAPHFVADLLGLESLTEQEIETLRIRFSDAGIGIASSAEFKLQVAAIQEIEAERRLHSIYLM